MPFSLLGVGIMIGLMLLSTALSYLLKPHTKKPNAFASPTYGWAGMQNSYEIGSPLNLAYGTIQEPPAILNWYRSGNSGQTRANFLGSLGHGQIAGVRNIKLNGQPIRQYYDSFNEDAEIYISHGEYKQKIYKFDRAVRGTITSIVTSGFNTTIVVTKSGRDFQAASATKPGYFVIRSSSADAGQETYESVRYLYVSQNSTTATFKGVKLSKTHAVGDILDQLYQIATDDDGNVRTSMPHMGSVATYHQLINSIEITTSWSTEFITNGKVDAFGITFEFPEGLYHFDDEGGYEPNQVTLAIRWREQGAGSWTTDVIPAQQTLAGTEYFIKVVRSQNFAIIVDASGTEITGSIDDLTGLTTPFDFLDGINPGMEIEFIGSYMGANTTYRYTIDSVITEQTGETTPDWAGNPIYLYRGKIIFRDRIKPSISSIPRYDGNNITSVAYTIYWWKNVKPNFAQIKIPEKPKVIQGNYQVTYQFPHDSLGREEKMPAFKRYEIQVKKILPKGNHNINSNAHKTVITSIDDFQINDLEYPGEALFGMNLLMTSKISGSIDNITAVVDGLLVKDTSENITSIAQWAANTAYNSLEDGSNQPTRIRALASAKDCKHYYRLIKTGTSGATEPDWLAISGAVIFDGDVGAGTHCEWQEDATKWSENPLDIICDLQQNKIYGRGQYLNFDNTILTELYDSYSVQDVNGISDRMYCNHAITENSKTRPRLGININIDFRQPIMDTLEVLAKSSRSYNVWDGQKLLTYIDRWRSPVTMVNNAITVPGSFKIYEVNVEDKINRFYASILNRYIGYKQDQVGRDYTDEGFSIGDLVMEQIHLYAITDKWHGDKILKYFLKYSNYIKHIISFEVGTDGCLFDVGDVIYFSEESTNNSVQIGTSKKWISTCGRVIAVSGVTFTTDKDVTVSNGQKVLLRKDNGTVTEYTISSQVGRVITVTASITSVSANSIYSLGTSDANNEYYRLFTCIGKKAKDYTYEIIGITYDDNIFKDIYNTGVIAQERTGVDISSIGDYHPTIPKLDSIKSLPPPVTTAIIKENPSVQGEAIVFITKPVDGNWSYAEAYIRVMGSEHWRYLGKTVGEPLKFSGLIPGESYEWKVESYSYEGKKSFLIHGNLTYGENTTVPPRPTGLQIINRMGTTSNIYGTSFKARWDDMAAQIRNSLTYATRMAGYEQIKYYLEIYFPTIPATVKMGYTSVKDMIARHETLESNKIEYTYEDTMEDISKIFEKYPTHPSYNTYYNVPQRTVKFRLCSLNNYSKKSEFTELTLTNPAPGMYLGTLPYGTNLVSPTLRKLKSGIRVSFPHPYDANGDEEYDISHFMVEYAENSVFTTNLKKIKVISSITVNSNDEEVTATSYTIDIMGLDPKKTYYIRVRPYDVFGSGTVSSTGSIAPGVTDDDTDSDIAYPAQVVGVSVALNSNNNIVVSLTKSSDIDVTKVIVDWRASQFTGTPTLTLTSVGGNIPILGEVDQGYLNSDNTKPVIGEKRSIEINLDETESHTKDSIIIKGAKTGYTYFVRLRFENSSRKQGAWSAWSYNATAVTGISDDDFAFRYKKAWYTGTIDDTSYRRATWTGVTMKVAKSGGGTTNYVITNGNTGDLATDGTGNRWIVWRSDYSSGTVFEVITDDALATDVTYKDAVAVAYIMPTSNTDGKITIIPTLGTKSDTITSSAIIAANSILANHIKVNSLASIIAILGSISAGDITLTHDGGGFIKFKDSTGKVAIRIRVNSGSDPDFVIMKSGQDADNGTDATDPSKVAFSTKLTISATNIRPTSPKIIGEGLASCAFTDQTTLANNTRSDVIEIQTSVPLNNYFTLAVWISNPTITLYSTPLEWDEIIYIDSTGIHELKYRARYYPATGIISIERYAVNTTNANRATGAITYAARWVLYSDTV